MICPYLFHLYNSRELLVGGESIAYNIGKDMLKYNIMPNLELEPKELEPEEPEANPLEVLVPILSHQRSNRLKKTNRAEAKSPLVQEFSRGHGEQLR